MNDEAKTSRNVAMYIIIIKYGVLALNILMRIFDTSPNINVWKQRIKKVLSGKALLIITLYFLFIEKATDINEIVPNMIAAL